MGSVNTKDGQQWFTPKGGNEKIPILDPRAIEVKTPGGLVRWTGTTTPDGKRVVGEESSVIASRGQLNVGGKVFDAHIFTDSRTGWQMAIDARSGEVYKATAGDKAWELQLGMTVRGDVLASGAMGMAEKLGASPEAARDIGFYAATGMKGISETGTVIRAGGALFNSKSSTPTTSPKTVVDGGTGKIPGMSW